VIKLHSALAISTVITGHQLTLTGSESE